MFNWISSHLLYIYTTLAAINIICYIYYTNIYKYHLLYILHKQLNTQPTRHIIMEHNNNIMVKNKQLYLPPHRNAIDGMQTKVVTSPVKIFQAFNWQCCSSYVCRRGGTQMPAVHQPKTSKSNVLLFIYKVLSSFSVEEAGWFGDWRLNDCLLFPVN